VFTDDGPVAAGSPDSAEGGAMNRRVEFERL
jgi:hypothetical protein